MPETCFVHPEGPLDLNTLVPGAKPHVFNAITAGQLITTEKITKSSKSVLQSYKSASFT